MLLLPLFFLLKFQFPPLRTDNYVVQYDFSKERGSVAMGCLKCGREIEEGAVFCQSCLANMAKYPVRPGTPVLLPSRERVSVKKAPKRRTVSAEDQVKGLKKRVRTMTTLWLVTLLAAVVFFVIVWLPLSGPKHRPGQNYTAVIATTQATTPTTAATSEPSGS